MTATGRPEAEFDCDAAMRSNLLRVFSERDAARRRAAIAELYAPDAVLYEPEAVVAGQAAISEAVDKLLSTLPPDFTFTPIGSAVGHHGLARLAWRGGPPEGPALVTGMDVARFERGRIQTLHVLIDPVAR